MPIAIICSPGLREFDFGPGHSFRGDRFEVFPEFLRKHLPEDNNYKMLTAEPATEDDLLLICEKDYIEFTTGYFKAANLGLDYPGQFSRYHSMDNMPYGGRPGKLEEAARLMVGQAKKACDLIQDGNFQKVVSIGGGVHHAKPAYGEGFCIYNDVAFCGRYLLQKYKLERILILDTDAHAGNGTAEYFYSDKRVLFIDIHQDPSTLYPGTGFAHQIGSGEGKGFTVNIPLPPGADFDSYKLAFETIIEPLTKEFKPQIIIRNGGSDPHFDDMLTNLGLTIAGFRMIGEKVRKMAEICDGRVIDLIASGYNKKVLPYGWLALIAGLGGFDIEISEPITPPQCHSSQMIFGYTRKVIDELKSYLKGYWKSI